MDSNNQLAKLDTTKIFEVIEGIPGLSEIDKKELRTRIISDDVELRKIALDKLRDSQIGLFELTTVTNEITKIHATGTQGTIATQTIKTGSGRVEIETKSIDPKLITIIKIICATIVIIAAFSYLSK